MRKSMWILGILLLHPYILKSQVIFENPLSPRNANYQMVVTLDVEKKQIQGHQVLTWTNLSRDLVQELQFHLYLNAFKNNRSTYFREKDGDTGILGEKEAWGWIDVDTLIANGTNLTDRIEFIHPDDNNEDDQTVIRIPLSRSIRPGQQIQVEMDYLAQLPYVYERNGYRKNFFFAAQWFPKIGVYIDGAWNCHQYHARSEFFADYGVYEVSITLPREYVVGATGTLQNTSESGANKTLTFRAEDVHDFAWTAWPEFRVAKETYKDVDITILYDKDHASSVPRYMRAVEIDLDFFSQWIGEYPYPGITVVDPPTGCSGVSGMEYPTLVTADTYWNIPKGLRFPEIVVIHEFGHNWWYGMVGNNEFEEAWLDEGINTYTEIKIFNTYFKKDRSLIDVLGIRVGELDFNRAQYIGMTRRDYSVKDAWSFIGKGTRTFLYVKPALMLWTLENIIGQETMDHVMRTFFQRWKFRHPKTQDFIDIVNEITGESYDWYFDQILKESYELDYQVASVCTKKVKKPMGHFDHEGERIVFPDSGERERGRSIDQGLKDSQNRDLYESRIDIHRQGEVIIPVDVLIVFEKGDSVRHVWDGRDRWIRYDFLRPTKLAYAAVDPDKKLLLDSNFANNSRTVKSQRKTLNYLNTRFLYWFQTMLHLFGFFG